MEMLVTYVHVFCLFQISLEPPTTSQAGADNEDIETIIYVEVDGNKEGGQSQEAATMTSECVA